MTPEQMMFAGAIGMAAAVVVFVLLVRRFRSMLARQLALQPQPAASSPQELANVDQQIAADLGQLIETMDALMKEIDAKLQARMAELDVTMADADAKILQIRQASAEISLQLDQAKADLLAHTEGAGGPIWEPPAACETVANAGVGAAAPAALSGQYEPSVSHESACSDTTPPEEDDDTVTLPGSWPLPPKSQPQSQPPAAATPAKLVGSRHSEVLKLHSQGLDRTDIARRLGLDTGEVELVLNLNRNALTQ